MIVDLLTELKNLFWPEDQSLVLRWIQICVFKIHMSLIKASIPTNDMSMCKVAIEEHFERD